jgi:tetratricopeptide (TPR) repeat protein
VRAAVAGAAIAAALLAAWSQWQPLRSEEAVHSAEALLARDPAGALAAANDAVTRNPLSPLALFTLADIQKFTGHRALARATLQRAVREQPSNPQTWVELGRYDVAGNPRAALGELQAAIYLNPESIAQELLTAEHPSPEAIEAIAIYNAYVQALRAVAAAPAIRSASAPPGRGAAGARQGARRRSGSAPARSGTP